MANIDNIFLLSKYQMKVLYYKCKEGASHEEIAKILNREVNTVQYHMTKIYRILEISKPGKSKEELDAELKNEICPTIRQLFSSIDDVKLWAPSVNRILNEEIEASEEGVDLKERAEALPLYHPPPSVEKVLKQTEYHPTPPAIIEPPPPGRVRTNWRRIIPWAIIVILIWFGLRFFPRLITRNNVPEDAPALPAAAEPLPKLEPTVFLTNEPAVTPSITPTPTGSPTASPTVIAIVTEISQKDGMVMVYVPVGEFTMGSSRSEDPQTLDEELPQHKVYLDAYWIDQTEVTNAQYALCVADGGACTKPSAENSLSRSSYYASSQFSNYPVIFVSWSQAAAYCAWAGRRLPSEAEWEKAARGPDGLIFPWGNTFDGSLTNYCDINCINGWKDNTFDDGYSDTSPVGDYPKGASVYGAQDMSGNIYEWVADWYGPYSRTDQANPNGPATGQERIIRGGSWGDDAAHIRVAVRSHVTPEYWMNFIGFRCAGDQD